MLHKVKLIMQDNIYKFYIVCRRVVFVLNPNIPKQNYRSYCMMMHHLPKPASVFGWSKIERLLSRLKTGNYYESNFLRLNNASSHDTDTQLIPFGKFCLFLGFSIYTLFFWMESTFLSYFLNSSYLTILYFIPIFMFCNCRLFPLVTISLVNLCIFCVQIWYVLSSKIQRDTPWYVSTRFYTRTIKLQDAHILKYQFFLLMTVFSVLKSIFASLLYLLTCILFEKYIDYIYYKVLW